MKPLSFIAIFLIMTTLSLQAQDGYKMPPDQIASLMDSPLTPYSSLSPDRTWLLLEGRPSLPSIAEVSQPELRLGGLRINPANNGRSRANYSNSIKLKNLVSMEEVNITGLPEPLLVGGLSWAPDGKKFAFEVNEGNGISLWWVDLETKAARRLTQPVLNGAVSGWTFAWLSDNEHLIIKTIPADRGAAPEVPNVPSGPTIRESSGQEAAVRTYQDLLKNQFDEKRFAYYTTSQLVEIDLNGTQKMLGEPAIYTYMSPSPDAAYILTQSVKQPFSYLVPYSRFAKEINVMDRSGKIVKQIADLPAAENIPKGFGAVAEGPRSVSWRSDADASLYWTEALDGGDPRAKAEFREQVYFLDAPFSGEAIKSVKLNLRFGGINWGSDNLALVSEWWWSNRQEITSAFTPGKEAAEKAVWFDRSWEDRYTDPGNFVQVSNEHGKRVMLFDKKGKSLFLRGQGASPEGNRPFIDRFSIEKRESERLWRSEAPYFESPVAFQNVDKLLMVTSRESKTEPANFYLRNLKKGDLTAVTNFSHPYPELKDVKKELVKYKRKDGVQLTGNLYLPAGYDVEKDGRIPVLLWAYPEEFKSADAAGQVNGSPYRFIRLYWASPLFWLTQGYAILDDPGMPIIGEGEEEPNDQFVDQLVANAEAAIDYLAERGIADRKKIAVGGHSYGAFMTANLLAHSDLFACGIARSGAYNRTLTPFGFQSEERSFWEAPDIYFGMSPFMHADKIKEPILLIHGEADNNSGTYPMQSERFYTALKGHGASVRLVMLPHESHGYRARESVMHMLWEMTAFMDKHLGEVVMGKSK